MRALHLIGLRAAGGQKLRFYPSDDAPLVLPSWFSASDREILLAFYQQILADDPLPRIEVDWYRSLVDADRGFLRNARERHGSGDYLVVVKVRHEGVDLREVLAQPELQAFQHVAVASDHPLGDEPLGRLGELTRFITMTAEELYDEMADELSLRPDGNTLLEPLVRTLLNPILVVEAYNALVDVHAEGVAAGEQGKAVYRRILGRLLYGLPRQLVVALTAIALRGMEGLAEAIPGTLGVAALTQLRERMLIRDGRLTRWARWLEEEGLRGLVREHLWEIVWPTREQADGAITVLEWMDGSGLAPAPKDPIRGRVLATFALLREGQLGRARDELTALERELSTPGVTDETRGNFWKAVTRLRFMMHERAQELAENGRWTEAEPLFREALQLAEDGRDTPTSRSVTMHYLAQGLAESGRWVEAEPLFRESLRLAEEGGDTPKSRAITLRALADGLRQNGRALEALRFLAQADELDPERHPR